MNLLELVPLIRKIQFIVEKGKKRANENISDIYLIIKVISVIPRSNYLRILFQICKRIIDKHIEVYCTGVETISLAKVWHLPVPKSLAVD